MSQTGIQTRNGAREMRYWPRPAPVKPAAQPVARPVQTSAGRTTPRPRRSRLLTARRAALSQIRAPRAPREQLSRSRRQTGGRLWARPSTVVEATPRVNSMLPHSGAAPALVRMPSCACAPASERRIPGLRSGTRDCVTMLHLVRTAPACHGEPQRPNAARANSRVQAGRRRRAARSASCSRPGARHIECCWRRRADQPARRSIAAGPGHTRAS